MTSNKADQLKEQFNQEFGLIYRLCEFVLENSQKLPLLKSTLQALLKFLSWIPVGYVFQTKTIQHLIFKVPKKKKKKKKKAIG